MVKEISINRKLKGIEINHEGVAKVTPVDTVNRLISLPFRPGVQIVESIEIQNQ